MKTEKTKTNQRQCLLIIQRLAKTPDHLAMQFKWQKT